MIKKQQLELRYTKNKQSMMQISKDLACSVHTVNYWMDKYGINRRTISEAIYQMHNPDGNPFCVKPITNVDEAKLLGMGLGLYWGEGNKKNKHAIRLGNTDPALMREFMRFLIELFGIDKNKFRFGLQIFSDMAPKDALKYWVSELSINPEQFSKIVVTPSRGEGTYRNKTTNGVLTLHFNNVKLRDIINEMLPR